MSVPMVMENPYAEAVAKQVAGALGMPPEITYADRDIIPALHRSSFYFFFLDFWKFISSETFKDNWHIEFICNELQKVGERVIRREPKEYDLIINVPPASSKSSLASVLFPAWLWTHDPSLQFLCGSYGDDLAKDLAEKFRRAIVNETYRGLFPNVQLQSSGVEVIRTMVGGWRKATSAGTAVQGWHAHLQLIDDPLNTKQAVSEAELKRANDWLTQLLPGRVTDAAMTPMVLIMQRLSQADCTATLLEKLVGQGTPVRHICIPAELEDGKNVYPRSLRAKYVNGLYDPNRFSQEVLDKKKVDLGEYAWCTPAESPVLMHDLSYRPIGKIKRGDLVIGFTSDTSDTSPEEGAKFRRRKLVLSEVLSISTSLREVIKITLDSGKVIRCTRDHKWFTGRSEKQIGNRRTYAALELCHRKPRAGFTNCVGRVCDPDENFELTDPQDIWLAGWLAGFFDGEGSVVLHNRRGPRKGSGGIISFCQGAGRNLFLCNKLEYALKHFGFDFGFKERDRTDRKKDSHANHKVRQYYIRHGRGMATFQRFLHLIKPLKWRRRLVHLGLGTDFIIGWEKPIKWEVDGVETVYGLETTTGNYVVWGLASSNSGQYQQRPTPLGGGIFKLGMMGEPASPPPLQHFVRLVRSWDKSASTTDKSPYTAGVLFGVDRAGIYWILDVVRGRWDVGQRENVIKNTAARDGRNVTVVIEQEPGSGGKESAQNTVRNLKGFRIHVDRVTGKKEERAVPLASQLNIGNVKMAKGSWNSVLLDEMKLFPFSRYKDQCDALSGAHNHLVGSRKRGSAF